jgi:type I restriction enzyme S subunit
VAETAPTITPPSAIWHHPLNPQPTSLNKPTLLSQFARIADAPDAIPRLRQFILDLAVRGKLVSQDPKDEPASELLTRILTEKAKRIKDGKMRRQQTGSDLRDEDTPFQIPRNWQWVWLIDLLTKLTDGTHHSPPNFRDGAFKYVSAKNIKPEGVSTSDITYVSCEVHREIYKRCDPVKGDILYIKDGATTGIVTVNNLDEPFSMLSSVALLKLAGGVYNRLLVNFLRSPFFYDQMREQMKGAAITRVTLKRMAPVPIPLPPLAEQHRIVAKVDELMALCDRLEAAQAERETRRTRLVAATHAGLSHSILDTRHSTFFINTLPRLTTRPADVSQLRQTILNLAVRGQLVPQDLNDEPAATLLAKNHQVRQAAAATDRRADAAEQILLAAGDRWHVPSAWDWRALADLTLFIDYRGQTPTKVDSGVRLITAKNVRKGAINLAPEEFLSEQTYQTWMTRGLPRKGDVLFTTEAPMGNAAAVRFSERFALAQRVIDLRPYGATAPDFLVLQILSQPFQTILDKTATGLTAKGIKAAKLKRLPIAVPPLAEQHRIVAKVDELMALCDRLEAQLATIQTQSRRLLESTLHQALAAT